MEISKEFFKTDIYFKTIKTEGFALYCYMLYKTNNKDNLTTTISEIIDFFNFNYVGRPNIKYHKNKGNQISLLKNKMTVIKYLKLLEKYKFIELSNKKEFSSDINHIEYLKVHKSIGENITVDDDFFETCIHNIGHIGWSLFCIINYLSKNKITIESISSLLNKDIKSINAYLTLLKDFKIIKSDDMVYEIELFTGENTKMLGYHVFNLQNLNEYIETNKRIYKDTAKENINKLSEIYLEDYLVKNLNKIEEGLILIKRQYYIKDGIVDILARDKNNILCIIELKIEDDCKIIIYQCVYYPTEFNEPTRMITVAPSYTDKIRVSLNTLGYVEMYSYDLINNDLNTLQIKAEY
jgi:hypothetical protein